MEALRLSTVERAAGTAIERYQTTFLLLRLVKDHLAQVINSRDEIPWRAALLQLKQDLGDLFASLGAKAETEVWLSSLEKDLEEIIVLINGDTGVLRVSDSQCTLAIEYDRLKVVENEEPTESRFKQVLELGEKMLAASYIATAQCHYLALVWAEKLYSGDEYTTIRTDIQFRTQRLFENVQMRLPDAAMNMTNIIRLRATHINEVAKNVEMLETFIRKNPQITLPMTRSSLLGMLNMLYTNGGYSEHANIEWQEAKGSLSKSLFTVFNWREASNLEMDQETLKVKDILDRQGAHDRQLDMMYRFMIQLKESGAPNLLQKLLVEESASGILTEQAMAHLFTAEESTESRVHDGLLKLNGQELLQKLVGTPEAPVYGAKWIKRRLTLRAWLLEESRPKLPIRKCLWVELHNARLRVWSKRFIAVESIWQKELLKTRELKTKNISFGLLTETRELIDAIEERLELKEARLGYSFNHYEKETRIFKSSLPQLYLLHFFFSLVPDEEPSDAGVAYLNHAEEIAWDQLAHWRSVNNYQWIAKHVVVIADIAQFKIGCRIIKESAMINRTLEEALELLEEVELLFGTTLYEVDLSHSLVTLESKVHMGSKMRIWTVGHTAIRLLLYAIKMINDKTEDSDSEESAASHQKQLLKLWQWVQRVKARTLSQSMGLDNMVPDVMLAGIQSSINDDRANPKIDLATFVYQTGQDDEAELAKSLEPVNLEDTSAAPLELLPEVRRFLKECGSVVPKGVVDPAPQAIPPDFQAYPPEMSSKIALGDIFSMSQDMQSAKMTAERIKSMGDGENKNKKALQEKQSEINERISMKPALQKLITIADFLNREEALLNEIEVGPASDRFQRRVELQRLRKEMQSEPVLQRMLRIREGWPLSSQDLHKIAASRKGKVAFVDWFRVSSLNQIEKLYMLIWRNGVCKLIDLNMEFKGAQKAIKDFFRDKDVYLPDVEPTPLKDMDLDRLIPKKVQVLDDDPQRVDLCMGLVRPLFDDALVEAEDLLVLSVTEGFNNFPLHAIEDSERGPLILHHPIVYTPSLSVLYNCYWIRYASNEMHTASRDKTLRSLVLGGIVPAKSDYQYGGKAVERIGSILHSRETTFVGAAATLSNFNTHISSSNLLHIHLHTNYDVKKKPEHALFSESTAEDVTFTNSPLDQAIVFNDPVPEGQLTARQILELKLAKGVHLNLVGCASGKQGKFEVDPNTALSSVTDEVMGLVPAFLFSGAGSVTSTMWPITDEHGAVFSLVFFRALMEAKEANCCVPQGQVLYRDEEFDGAFWVDLAEVHQKAVLEMRKIYKQPSAWASFVLSGYWKFMTA